MKTPTLLFVSAAASILAACGGSGTGGSSDIRRIAASAESQKAGVQYFEVANPSSLEQVITAFDEGDGLVFSIDYLSDAARTQRTITVTAPHVFRTRTVSEASSSTPSSGAGGVHLQMTKECGYYYTQLAISFVTGAWDDFDFWAESIDAFCSGPLVA